MFPFHTSPGSLRSCPALWRWKAVSHFAIGAALFAVEIRRAVVFALSVWKPPRGVLVLDANPSYMWQEHGVRLLFLAFFSNFDASIRTRHRSFGCDKSASSQHNDGKQNFHRRDRTDEDETLLLLFSLGQQRGRPAWAGDFTLMTHDRVRGEEKANNRQLQYKHSGGRGEGPSSLMKTDDTLNALGRSTLSYSTLGISQHLGLLKEEGATAEF